MIARPATAAPAPMPAFAPVDSSESVETASVDVGDGYFVMVAVFDVEVEEELEADDERPVWLANASRGAEAGMNLSKSDDCHATEIGLANATVTEASPGSCVVCS